MSLASRGLVGAVRYYQRVLSPRKPVPTCRFTPTCSEYAAQAITLHGAVKGGWLATWRVVRCNPMVPGGYDPVPEHFPGEHFPGQRQHSPGQNLAQEASNAPPPAAPLPASQPSPSSKSPSPKKRRVS